MIEHIHTITFNRHSSIEPVPYDLLLLADPSKDLIDQYLTHSEMYTSKQNNEIIGVIVVFPLSAETVEIKNIAVQPTFQGQGIGRYMIEKIIQISTLNKKKSIGISTANSSIGQLYLYQKLGFEISEIRKDFFIKNYKEPIYENGIQAKHLLVMSRPL